MDERRAEYTVSSRDFAGWLRQLYPAPYSVNLEYSDRVIQTFCGKLKQRLAIIEHRGQPSNRMRPESLAMTATDSFDRQDLSCLLYSVQSSHAETCKRNSFSVERSLPRCNPILTLSR